MKQNGEIRVTKNIDTLKMKFEIHKAWHDVEGEPCSQLVYKKYKAEIGATECCYYGFVIHPNGTQVDAPPELQTQQELKDWCEEHIFNSHLMRTLADQMDKMGIETSDYQGWNQSMRH